MEYYASNSTVRSTVYVSVIRDYMIIDQIVSVITVNINFSHTVNMHSCNTRVGTWTYAGFHRGRHSWVSVIIKTYVTADRLTNGWDLLASLGHPCKFQRVSRLGSVTARHSSSGRQPNFAALNRGRHLYSAGRPSHCALAHILVKIKFEMQQEKKRN